MDYYEAHYKPYVMVKGKKVFTENVMMMLSSDNKKDAMEEAISTLIENGYKHARTNKKYITLEEVV